MNNAINNVAGLHQSSVYEDIQTFLSKYERRSENTRGLYERCIRKFFMYLKNKNIENLIENDLIVRNVDMLKYQGFLTDQYDSNTTINAYTTPIFSLYDFFEVNEYPVKAKTVHIDLLPDDSDKYGKISIQEAELMAQLVKPEYKGQEKSALIRMAYTTSFRKSELLNIKWQSITYNHDQDLYLVRVTGKRGKINEMPISHDLYEELLKIKECGYYKRYNDDKIFHLSKTTVQTTMKNLKFKMNISESRKVVFHSLRNVLANYIKENEKDPYKIKEQLNHANINTSMRYLEESKDYRNMAGIQIENKIDDNVFDELSRDEMIQLLKGTVNGINLQLKMTAKKIIEGRG